MAYKNTVKDYSQMIGYLTRDKTTDVPGSMAHGLRTGFYDGGRIGFNKAPGSVKTKVVDAIGRTYDSDNMGRKPKLEGKVGRIVEYLQDLSDGASFYKPDVAKELNLGLAKDGSIDTSLLTKAINSRDELKNKNFKFISTINSFS